MTFDDGASIYIKFFAGDEAGFLTCQEHDAFSYILGQSPATNRNQVDHVFGICADFDLMVKDWNSSATASAKMR